MFLLLVSGLLHAQAPPILWQNTIGGDEYDELQSAVQTADGGYLLGGSSNSNEGGDKTEDRIEDDDYWIVRLDNLGNILWDETIGSTGRDELYVVEQLEDGGFILGGESESNAGYDKSENKIGKADLWIVRIDGEGNIIWENTIGGTNDDFFSGLRKTDDGGFIIASTSFSNASGDKSEDRISDYDYWVVKISSLGEPEWDRTIGGMSADWLSEVVQTTDGGYILGGKSTSEIGVHKTENTIGPFYNPDFWMVKLDAVGNIIWDNTIGGTFYDVVTDVIPSPDNGCIVVGYSDSNASPDKSEDNKGETDYWIVALDENGNILWDKVVGGSEGEYPNRINVDADGNYLIIGTSTSQISGDKTENMYGDPGYAHPDFWVVKLSPTGSIIWDKTLGGFTYDLSTVMIPTNDGGLLAGGYSDSDINGVKTELSVYYDYWIIKMGNDDCTPLPETCNELDDDCDGAVDEGLPIYTYYQDADTDTYGDATDFISACTIMPPSGYVADSTDCADGNAAINPGAAEVCNGFDDNCNGLTDDALPIFDYYADTDDDGFGNPLILISTCYPDAPVGYTSDNTDCDDTNPDIHMEIQYFADMDGDFYGDSGATIWLCAAFPPEGYVTNSTDCNDLAFFINPGSNEICNSLDDDCDITIDEDLPLYTLYPDADGDTYGDALAPFISCSPILKDYVLVSGDCDDTNPFIYPDAEEILNGLDDDCDEQIDEGLSTLYQSQTFNSLMLYPNPATQFLYINGSAQISFQQPFIIEAYNLKGQLVLNTTTHLQTPINVSSLPPGTYMFRVCNSEKISYHTELLVITE